MGFFFGVGYLSVRVRIGGGVEIPWRLYVDREIQTVKTWKVYLPVFHEEIQTEKVSRITKIPSRYNREVKKSSLSLQGKYQYNVKQIGK